MTKNFTDACMENNAKGLYDRICHEFSATRKRPWPEWEIFVPYLKPAKSLLDVGCGNGRFSSFCRTHQLVYEGLDISAGLLSEAKILFPDEKFRQGDALSLPYADEEFDYVASIAVLHHLQSENDRTSGIKEMFRVMKSGGLLFLMVWNLLDNEKYIKEKSIAASIALDDITKSPQDFIIPWGRSKIPRYYYAFKPDELGRLLEKAGFLTEKICYSGGKEIDSNNVPDRTCNIVAVCRKKSQY